MQPLGTYISESYTYNPEENLLLEICRRIGIPDNSDSQFLEFGAMDGKTISNCAILSDREWSGVFIEASKPLFDLLIDNYRSNPKMLLLNLLVSREKDSELCLDKIASTTFLKFDFDVLSIDIDSYDLEIWYNFRNFSPKVVIIEVNPTIPVGVHNWCGYNSLGGNSFSSTLQVGIEKGYTLICAPTINLYFVRNDLVKLISIEEIYLRHPELLFRSVIEYKPNFFRKTLSRLKTMAKLLSPDFREKFLESNRRSKRLQNLEKFYIKF